MDKRSPALKLIRRWGVYGLLLMPLLFLAIFYFYPLASILGVSFAPQGQLDLSGFRRIITTPYYAKTLWFTTWQAVVSTLLTLGLALPGAYVVTRYRFPGKSILMALATLPFVLPTVVVAAAFSALIGNNGLLNKALESLFSLDRPPIQLEQTLALILIVHVFYNYAIALRIISSYWANQSLRMEESARVLGCRGWRLWWEIRLPVLRPAILAAGVLIFIFTFTSFGVILILGGVRYATLEVEIYKQTVYYFDGLPVAAALSLVQIGIMSVMMLIYTRLQQGNSGDLRSVRQIARNPETRGEKLLVMSNVGLMVILLFAPLLALVARSFTLDGGLTTHFYTRLSQNPRGSVLFVPPVEAIWNSVKFALITTILAVSLGLLASYLLMQRRFRWLDPLFMLPLATSAVTLGFGFIIALDEPPLNLRTSPILIPLAHTLVALPFVVRSILPSLKSIPANIREAGSVLGASPWRIWRLIELPLVSRGVVVGATFAFTVSMGEFGASLFIARPDTPTMPIVIYTLIRQPGVSNYGQALAMSVLLMGVCAVSFLLIERVRTAGVGEF
ncbi:MAG: iron ABC transporter permease [Chitinophagaceae bacterium]|nr:iron ABC transporter permease [Anaerolineae bacterium]